MTKLGKALLTLVILTIVGIGGMRWMKSTPSPQTPHPNSDTSAPPSPVSQPANAKTGSTLSECSTLTAVPSLALPATARLDNNTLLIELSEYPGYSGLIVANGGLEPSENSFFFKNYGFKVKIVLSEEESWSSLNQGRIHASATTVDVLAVYGRQLHAVVPALIGYSRGADGIVVRKDIRKLNDLAGKVILTGQFTEADFFLRYLAQEATVPVVLMNDPAQPPAPDKINLLGCEDAFAAADIFLAELSKPSSPVAGCVTWSPKTTETVEASAGAARLLVTNTNLLIVADVLLLHKGLAKERPEIADALVHGLLEGNRLVRDQIESSLPVICKAFGWEPAQARAELAKVHFANFPENKAFFAGAMESAGSYAGIYQSAVLAYGNELLKNPVDADYFRHASSLQAIGEKGLFAGQTISIQPVGTASRGAVEGDPLLSKNIRFLFEANSSRLDLRTQSNLDNLASLRNLLQVSPGSVILLRGHVDDSLKDQFRKEGGEQFLRQMALKAVSLSKERASDIKKQLVERERVEASRVEIVGRGWEEPVGKIAEQNRRVEAQWFTIE